MNLNQFNTILNSGNKHIVVMSASWCMPCKILKKTLNTIIEKYPQTEKQIHSCDIENSEELVQEFNITSVPTIFFIQNKEKQERKGLQQENTILEFLK
jgi:thioredoxin 1